MTRTVHGQIVPDQSCFIVNCNRIVPIPEEGQLQLIHGGEASIAAGYKVVGDKLPLTIDGKPVEYNPGMKWG